MSISYLLNKVPKHVEKQPGQFIKGMRTCYLEVQTGCPRQENMIPPMAAETTTTTKSDISLQTDT